jgi:Pyridoxamine 5'-phosphate oxidase
VTASLPAEVRESFSRFVTTEFTTIDSRQQPITWPVTPYYSPGGPTIDVTTGLGYPKKADDARRNPRVALLFSDPTGSGIETGIQVLVQGIATVDEDDLAANAKRYLQESGEKLPATKKLHPPEFLRGPLNWYYARIYVDVRPERVWVWSNGNLLEPPEIHDSHVEEVRSGHNEEPAAARAAAIGGEIAWDARITELGTRHPMAVLSWVGPDGFPIAVRVPVQLDQAERRIRLGLEPTGLPLAECRACLTAHAHGPDFSWQENFQVRGDLVEFEPGEWAIVPRKLVGGFELPQGMRKYRSFAERHWRFYKTAKARLKARG